MFTNRNFVLLLPFLATLTLTGKAQKEKRNENQQQQKVAISLFHFPRIFFAPELALVLYF